MFQSNVENCIFLYSIFQMSQAEKDHVKQIHANLDQLTLATSQIDETLFVMNTYLQYTK